jgi:large subunit ribosomal protein L23
MNTSHVILGPVVTEKSMKLLESNQTVILVHPDANKTEVKQAVEKFYGIKPTGVQMIKMPEKYRTRGKFGPQRKRKPRKKAIVSLPKGKNLDLLKLTGAPKVNKKTTKKTETTSDKPQSSVES